MHEKTNKSDFQAKEIDSSICWIDRSEPDNLSAFMQIIIPQISFVSALLCYVNEMDEDRWKFAIGFNGKVEWFVYFTKETAYAKYNELINKITHCYIKGI